MFDTYTSNAAQHAGEILDADRVAFSDGVSEVLCTMAHQLVAMKDAAPSDSGDEFIADLS